MGPQDRPQPQNSPVPGPKFQPIQCNWSRFGNIFETIVAQWIRGNEHIHQFFPAARLLVRAWGTNSKKTGPAGLAIKR